jgi:hypothetical protein
VTIAQISNGELGLNVRTKLNSVIDLTGTSHPYTSGSIVFVSSSGNLAQDNANFFWDDSGDILKIKSELDFQGTSALFKVNSVLVLDYNSTLADFWTSAKCMQILPGTITTSGAMFNLIATFNNGAANFVATYVQVTRTASAGPSGDWFALYVQGGVGQVAGIRWDGTVFGSQFCTNDISTACLIDSSQGGTGLELGASGTIKWAGSGAFYNTKDVGLARNAAGVLEINNGTAATLRDLKARTLITSELNFPSTTAVVKVNGSTLLDYGVSTTYGWTFADTVYVNTFPALGLSLATANAYGSQFGMNATGGGGHNYLFVATGTSNNPGYFVFSDYTASITPFALGPTGNVQLFATLGWANSSTDATATVDSGISRNAAGVLEINNGTAGTFRDLKLRSSLYAGSTSGVITVQPQAAAGTYNFNLPITAGSAGQVLTSQGGGATAMTWASPGAASMAIGSAVTSGTTGSVLFVGAGPVLAQDNTNFFWDDTNNLFKLSNSAIIFGPAPAAVFGGSVGMVIGDGTAANSGATPGFIVNSPGAASQGAFCGFSIVGVDAAYFGTKGGVEGGGVAQGLNDLMFMANNMTNGGGVRFTANGTTSAKGQFLFKSSSTGSAATILDYSVTTANIWTFSVDVKVVSTTAASSNVTGALTTAGGVGIGKDLYLATGTNAIAPLTFTSGVSLTTARAGAMEYDGKVFYATPDNSNRGVCVSTYVIRQDSTYTLSNSASVQKLFNASTNGAVTLATGTYYFECLVYLTAMSATSNNAAFSLAGAATLGSHLWYWTAFDGAAGATSAFQSGVSITAATPAAMATAAVATTMPFMVKGTFEVTGTGTVIPSIQLANASAAIVAIGSYFMCYPMGGTTLTFVGNWS